MYASHTRARYVEKCITLPTTKKGTQSVAEYYSKMRGVTAEYYSKMRGYTDEIATSSHPLSDEEFVSYLLAGLGVDFDPMVSVVVACVEHINLAELYSQMLSHELCRNHHSDDDLDSYSSTNVDVRGRGGPRRFPGHGRGRGCDGGGRSSGQSSNSRSPGPRSSDASTGRPRCQVCIQPGHTTNICWYRFDEDYILEQKTDVATSTSHASDSNWYFDLGAIDHITSELDKLTMHDRYHGGDQARAANGPGMHISSIDSSVIPTTSHNLHLHNALHHVPHANKHLVFVHRFNLDNHTFIELHPHCFLIKDQVTRKVLLRGPCRGRLYPIPSHVPPSLQKYASAIIKLSSDHWHNRLGHPSLHIVHRVIRDNNLSYSSLSNNGVAGLRRRPESGWGVNGSRIKLFTRIDLCPKIKTPGNLYARR
jgi:hypothetical protein